MSVLRRVRAGLARLVGSSRRRRRVVLNEDYRRARTQGYLQGQATSRNIGDPFH